MSGDLHVCFDLQLVLADAYVQAALAFVGYPLHCLRAVVQCFQAESQRLSKKLEELESERAQVGERAAAAEAAKATAEQKLAAAEGQLKDLETKLTVSEAAASKVPFCSLYSTVSTPKSACKHA